MNGSFYFWYTAGMKKTSPMLIERAFGKGRKRGAFRATVFAAILLPTLAIMFLSFFLLKDALTAREAARRQTTVERDKLFAHAIANGISIYVEAALDAVKTASAEAARRPMTPDGMRSVITDMVGNTRAFFASSIGDADGRAVLVYDPNGTTEETRYRSGFDLSQREYFQRLLATKQPVVSDAITSLVSPQPTVAVAAPILDDRGEVKGFATGGVSLGPLYELALAELGSEIAIPVVVDRQGQVLVHPDRSLIEAHENLAGLEPAKRALRGEDGFIDTFTDVDGRERSAAYVPVPGLGWAVWVAQEPPTGAALFVRRELQRTMIFYGLILLVNVILAAVVWSLLRALFIMHEKERAFLESIGDGVIAVDRAWKIILWNRTATQLTGWSEEEAMGRPFRDHVRFIRERDRKENLAFIEEAMLFGETRPMSNSTILVTRDGRELPISDSAAPLFDEEGTVDGVIIIFRDATREKDAAMLRTDFAYASHQLRTPVNKAMWDIELAIDEARDPGLRERLQVAYSSIRDVQKLSTRLIDVSQIDQRHIVPVYEEVRVADILKEALAGIEGEVKRRKVRILAKPVRADLTVDTDPKLLRTALQEIIENAALYSAASGTVEIVVQAEKLDIVFQVMDRGIGISDEQKPLIFTKFFRGQNVPQDAHGAGLGLFTAREYVRLLGGKIWFDSRLGFGTTFTVAIPRMRGMKE